VKWKLYWSGLATILFGTSVIVNRRRHRQWNWWQVLGKAVLDTSLVSGLCWLWPPLLISFAVVWLVGKLKIRDLELRLLVFAAVGFAMTAAATWALEILALVGIASIGDLSLKLLRFRQHWREADQPRLVEDAA